ncbi:MAG: CoA transferase [Dehalococcoidia bacterium]|nr:CoA transferase [Dehalococcoidia bacterium]
MAKALDGIKVLDFTRALAGPFCTLQLAELGAEVIKIEIPEGGDLMRGSPQTVGDENYMFIVANRGKKSITLNLSSERGREICKELVKKVDVLVENFSPGVMDRLGLGYEELKKVNPGLIYASSSGFGHTGPRSSQTAYDMIIQAMSGYMSVNGYPDSPPTKGGGAIGDTIPALYNTISILAALHYRARTGEGQHIDISMQDCMWAILGPTEVSCYFRTGEDPPRMGNRERDVGPYGAYTAKDGYVVIAVVTVGQWQNFLRIIGREDLIGVEKYATQAERSKHMDEVDALVEEWTRERTMKEIVNTLNDAHLPCSPIPTFAEAANDPQILSRGMVTEVEQVISGRLKVPGSPFKLSKTPGDPTAPAPFLGQHNYEVYSNVLGYSEQEISKLADDGII